MEILYRYIGCAFDFGSYRTFYQQHYTLSKGTLSKGKVLLEAAHPNVKPYAMIRVIQHPPKARIIRACGILTTYEE